MLSTILLATAMTLIGAKILKDESQAQNVVRQKIRIHDEHHQ